MKNSDSRMKKRKRNMGFTLAELLLVVAIILILAGLAFIGVIQYRRALKQLELDGIAKEIFVSAQNHLTMADSQGLLNQAPRKDYPGTAGTVDNNAKDDVYYFVYSSNDLDDPDDETSILNLMLPFAAVDETVRKGSGSYLIRYQKSSAMVLDVFYTDDTNGFRRDEYSSLLEKRGTGLNKLDRRGTSGRVIGWYGDGKAIRTVEDLEAPTLRVINGDRLEAIVNNPNWSKDYASLQLIISSENGKKYITLIDASEESVQTYHESDVGGKEEFVVSLDDVTVSDGHFADLFGSESAKASKGDPVGYAMIPGEDITIKAVSFSYTEFANIAESGEQTTNSLFASVETPESTSTSTAQTAKISSIRHLENLDKNISSPSVDWVFKDVSTLNAEQTTDLYWTKKTAGSDITQGFMENTEPASGSTQVYGGKDVGTSAEGTYLPVSPEYTLHYNGMGHSITGLTVDTTASTTVKKEAGLFGVLSSSSSVEDLELIDFSISGSAEAGALAGKLTGTNSKLSNVLVRVSTAVRYDKKKEKDDDDDDDDTWIISGEKDTGGLVGSMDGGNVDYCAAAVRVNSSGGNAGGLIGSSAATIRYSFSGGHTTNGAYSTTDYNVTAGGNAGGLVGSASATNKYIQNSYSTCSVSGATAGGLVGTVTGEIISNCYSTGLVNGTSAGAFAGSAKVENLGTNNHYFAIINEGMNPIGDITPDETTKKTKGVDAIDETLKSYSEFTKVVSGDTGNSYPYDPKLIVDYQAKYYFPLVSTPTQAAENKVNYFVKSHYGDWPTPETNVVNTKD